MNISKISNVRVEAISACVPSNTVNNREFAKMHFPDVDLTNTITALGVEERHVCSSAKTTSLDLCVEAAKKIFASGFDKSEIGAVVFVTLTPDCLMPNNASYVQYLLGLKKGIPAFDINHACSGYLYGLWNAAMVANNMGVKVLLLDGDVNTHYVSPDDKSTALLFGDAGTATIISPSEGAKDWNFTFNTDGSNRDAILMRLGFRDLISENLLKYKTYEDGSKRRFIDMQMDGRRVFDYVVLTVPKIVREFMDELETGPSEFDKLLLHQANFFMLRKLAKAIGFSKEVMPVSMDKYGNTSSVSIPLTICSELQGKDIGNVLMIGMGAGLATGIGDISLKDARFFGVENIEC